LENDKNNNVPEEYNPFDEKHITIIQVDDPEIPGYKLIFNHNRYCISNDGNVWDKYKQEHVQPYDHGGYVGVALTNNDGECRTHLVHRLVGMAYLNVDPKKVRKLVINHKDGNKSNNYVDLKDPHGPTTNLEWCTRAENNQHAIDTGLKPGYVTQVKDLKTNECKSFMSMLGAAKYCNIGKPTLSVYLKDKAQYAIGGRYIARRLLNEITEDSPWDFDPTNRPMTPTEAGGIKAYNVDTGEEVFVSVMREVVKHTGVSDSQIRRKLRTSIGSRKPCNNWLFKLANDESDWVSTGEPYNRSKKIKLKHPDGSVHEYVSCSMCSKQTGIELSNLTRRINGEIKNMSIIGGYEVI